MATIRQGNFVAQQRLDVPHLRSIESAVARDFDILAGAIMAGNKALVVKGFSLVTAGAIGAPASSLQMVVADGVLLHPLASESGTLYIVPSSAPNESLNSANANVIGSFTPSQVNYIGIDLRRLADPSTSDFVAFLDPDTLEETSRVIPLARTLQHRIVISTTDFDAQPTVLPIAKVTLNGSGVVTAIEDARNMAYRLGRGGSVPDPDAPYSWPGGRDETIQEAAGDYFNGGDKAIDSLKSWMDAVMTRIWELGGGDRWYGATVDRNIILVWDGAPFPTGENFYWDGTDLTWTGLKFLFDNSPGWYNDVADQTTAQPGLTDLAVGDALYVDIDRAQNTTVTAAKANLNTLGSGNPPGARQIIAWRTANGIFTRNWRYALGTAGNPATTSTIGMVAVSSAPSNPNLPVAINAEEKGVAGGVATLDASLNVVADGITRGTAGVLSIGGGANDTSVQIGSSSNYMEVVGEGIFLDRLTLIDPNNTNILDSKFDGDNLLPHVEQQDGDSSYRLVKGYQRGLARNGVSVGFPIPYERTPTVRLSGGVIMNANDDAWGGAANNPYNPSNYTSGAGNNNFIVRDVLEAQSLTPLGFIPKAVLRASRAGTSTSYTAGTVDPNPATGVGQWQESVDMPAASGAGTVPSCVVHVRGSLDVWAKAISGVDSTGVFPDVEFFGTETKRTQRAQVTLALDYSTNGGSTWTPVGGVPQWTQTVTTSATATPPPSGTPKVTKESTNSISLDRDITLDIGAIGFPASITTSTRFRVRVVALSTNRLSASSYTGPVDGVEDGGYGPNGLIAGLKAVAVSYTVATGTINAEASKTPDPGDFVVWEAWLD